MLFLSAEAPTYLNGQDFSTIDGIKHTDLAVKTCRRQTLALGSKRKINRPNPVRVLHLECFRAAMLEDSHVIVGARRRKQITIGAPLHSTTPVRVATEVNLWLLYHRRRHSLTRPRQPAEHGDFFFWILQSQ